MPYGAMNIAFCRQSAAVFAYCVLIVSGQPTTDHDVDKDEISLRNLVDAVEKLRAELRLEKVKSADTITELKDKIAKLERKGT